MKQATTAPAQPRTRFLYVVAAIAAIGGVLFGFDTGVISGAILFITQQFHLTASLEEVTTSAVLVGAVIGALIGGPLADQLGRRRVIIGAAVVFLVGTLICVVAQLIALFIAGRIIVGVAIGVASFAVPLYLSEIAPSRVRGTMVSLNQLAVVSGILVSYGVDYLFASTQNWRAMFAVGVIPGLILLIGLLFTPDSPRWLLRRHREEQARAVLQRIRARADVSDELAAIKGGLSMEQGGGWADLLSPAVKMPLLVGVGLALLQQVTGINTVIYYAPTIFEFAGFKSAAVSIAATAGVGVVNVVMTLVAIWLVDRAGRRPLLLWGIAGMAISLLVLGAGFAFGRAGRGASGGWLGWLTAGSLMVYVGTFALGLGPVFWLLIAEIYPLTVRARAMSVATVANWGANLLVAVTFLTLTQVLGRAGTFWLYAVVALVAWVFALRLVPETKGKTLEEIEAHWHAGKHPRELGRTPPGHTNG
jgi:SP family galactose:H+ symporter-like MFS transporter